MSASNKKKLRKQEAEGQMTQRQQAASKEAKKQRTTTLTFCVVMVLIVCITIGALLTNPVKNITYRNVKAVEVGEYTLSAVELNYFYVDAISQFYQNNSSFISYLLDTKKPLDQQVYDKTTGKTWADYMLDSAYSNIKSTYAVYNLAVSEGYTLNEEYQSELSTAMMYMSLYGTINGFSNTDAYLAAMYGNGATEESYREYYEKCLIAEAYCIDYSEKLSYSTEDLDAYHQEHTGEFFSYNFAYYYLDITKFYPEDAGTLGEDGKTKVYTAEETAAAVAAAQAAAEALVNGEYEDIFALDAAIGQLPFNQKTESEEDDEDDTETKTGETEGETEGDDVTEGEGETEEEPEEEEKKLSYLTEKEDALYSSISKTYADWIIGKIAGENEDDEPTFETRNEGDMKFFENSTGEGESKTIKGFYVVRYESVNDNNFALKNVRHILISFKHLKADGTVDSSNTSTTYTDAEKAAAKKEAEELLEEWKNGKATELTFETLAKEKSEDTGSKDNGGLYENIFPGQMVENFENWCYDESRQVGDYGIVETDYGYHIMYFSGNSEQTYINYMLTETMRSEDTNAWYEALIETMTVNALTDKYVPKDKSMS